MLHCGQEARLPAALAGTFSARPQPEQWNSIDSEAVEEDIRHSSFGFLVSSARPPLGQLPVLGEFGLSIVSILRAGQ